MGVASLVLGIVGLVFSFIPCLGMYGIGLTIPGVVLGAIAISKAKKNNGQGKGLAIAGLVCSIIGSAIAGWQCYVIYQASQSSGLQELSKAFEEAAKEAAKEVSKDVK